MRIAVVALVAGACGSAPAPLKNQSAPPTEAVSACPRLAAPSIAEGWEHVMFPQCPPMPLHVHTGYACPAGGCPRPCREMQGSDDLVESQLIFYDARGRWIRASEESPRNARDQRLAWTREATYEGDRVVKFRWGNGYGEGDIDLAYDEQGHLATAGEYTSFEWGAHGPTRIHAHGTTEIDYDAAGRVSAHRHDRHGAFSYVYAGNNLVEVHEERAGTRVRFSYHYDERNRVRSIREHGPGAPDDVFAAIEFSYDVKDRPLEVVHRPETGSVTGYRYEYDCR